MTRGSLVPWKQALLVTSVTFRAVTEVSPSTATFHKPFAGLLRVRPWASSLATSLDKEEEESQAPLSNAKYSKAGNLGDVNSELVSIT